MSATTKKISIQALKPYQEFVALPKKAADRLKAYREKRSELLTALAKDRDWSPEGRQKLVAKLREEAVADIEKIMQDQPILQAMVEIALEPRADPPTDTTSAFLIESSWQKAKALLDKHMGHEPSLRKTFETLATQAHRTKDAHMLAALKANIGLYLQTVEASTDPRDRKNTNNLAQALQDPSDSSFPWCVWLVTND